MTLINEISTLALATRMQKLGDALRRDASRVYKEHGIEFEAKWFPVVYLLSKKSPLSVTELAGELGYAHPSVIALTRELQSKKLVKSTSHESDGRKRMLSLTPKALEMIGMMEPLWEKMRRVNNVITDNRNNLLKAIEETEEQLERQSFYDRMQRLLQDE